MASVQPQDPHDPETSAAKPEKRSAVRTVFGWFFIGIATLATVGSLANLANGGLESSTTAAETLGVVLGLVVLIVVPLVIGVLLLRRKAASDPGPLGSAAE